MTNQLKFKSHTERDAQQEQPTRLLDHKADDPPLEVPSHPVKFATETPHAKGQDYNCDEQSHNAEETAELIVIGVRKGATQLE